MSTSKLYIINKSSFLSSRLRAVLGTVNGAAFWQRCKSIVCVKLSDSRSRSQHSWKSPRKLFRWLSDFSSISGTVCSTRSIQPFNLVQSTPGCMTIMSAFWSSPAIEEHFLLFIQTRQLHILHFSSFKRQYKSFKTSAYIFVLVTDVRVRYFKIIKNLFLFKTLSHLSSQKLSAPDLCITVPKTVQ